MGGIIASGGEGRSTTDADANANDHDHETTCLRSRDMERRLLPWPVPDQHVVVVVGVVVGVR
jgi:hypothetical protein